MIFRVKTRIITISLCTIPYLDPGRYLLKPSLPDDSWYLRSIAVSSPERAQSNPRASVARVNPTSGIPLKAGENLAGINLTLSEGAASLQGKLIAKKENSPLPSRLRVYLAPMNRLKLMIYAVIMKP